MKNIFLTFMIGFGVAGCSDETVREPPETPSEVLNEVVRSAPYQFIDLDQIEVREIELSDDDIVYDVNREIDEGEPVIGSLNYFTYADNRFFIYDDRSNAIFQIAKNGAAEGPLTRWGNGPGEHEVISGIQANSRYLYAPDGNNGRINRYTHEMLQADPLQDYVSHGGIDVNDEIMLTVNRFNENFAPGKPEQGLISVFSIENLNDTLATILPRIIPPGYQPAVYNSPMFSMNGKNHIAASYYPLPWLFLFDEEYNHRLTLIFESSVFVDTVPMEFFKPKGNEGFGGSIQPPQFTLSDNGDLFISVAGKKTPTNHSASGNVPFERAYKVDYFQLVHLSPGPDGTYSIKDAYTFRKKNDGQKLWAMELVLTEEENVLYGRNFEYLFKIKLID